ncbi:MAG TPA: hypothetical protein VK781_14290 [Solirubrobacteraceae bacterium]|jgi:hypothetical protein|nr:hypothetical protein [Solirubrobacteraceae bacterium]
MATEAPPQAPETELPATAAASTPDRSPVADGPPKDAPIKVKEPKKEAKGSKKPKASKEKAKGKKGEESTAEGPSVAAHPRAARQVARAKGWGGLVGFVLGGYLSLPTHTFAETGARAIAAGVVCYLVAWAGAVFAWRHLVVLEIKGREQQLLAAAYPGPPESAALTAGPASAELARARTTP